MTDFVGFGKIPRLFRDIVITEKIDGTNGCIYILEDSEQRMLVGSRTRWITPEADNHGFAKWAYENWLELRKLGPGRHFGEWWGHRINRGYGLKEKRFSLFNVTKWSDPSVRPACCHVVPVLFEGLFDTMSVSKVLSVLRTCGSQAATGFMRPEGMVIYHKAGNLLFKVTLEKDEEYKSAARPVAPV